MYLRGKQEQNNYNHFNNKVSIQFIFISDNSSISVIGGHVKERARPERGSLILCSGATNQQLSRSRIINRDVDNCF